MSMEDAIKDHAAAIRELAAAVNQRTAWLEQGANALEDIQRVRSSDGERVTGMPKAMAAPYSGVRGSTAEEAAADYIPGKKDRADGTKPDAELEQAVQKIEADAKAPNAADGAAESADTSTGAQSEDDDTIDAGDVALDYGKDVKPVLLSLFKKKGADALGGLLTKHLPGVAKPKGDMLKPEQLAGVLAEANAILAA